MGGEIFEQSPGVGVCVAEAMRDGMEVRELSAGGEVAAMPSSNLRHGTVAALLSFFSFLLTALYFLSADWFALTCYIENWV